MRTFPTGGSTENNSDYSEDYLLTKKGRARSLRPIDEFFMVMCRLRQGFLEDHLAQLFNVSASTVSRIIITWVNFMFFKFGQINIWPSRKVIDTTMPEAFKGKYKSTRVIIDCTEVRCQMPSSLQSIERRTFQFLQKSHNFERFCWHFS